MSGRVDQRERRRVPPLHVRQLARQVRQDLPDLHSLQLPDFNLDAPGLLVEVIGELVRGSRISELCVPERVTRTVPGGNANVPFAGDLNRLGPNSK